MSPGRKADLYSFHCYLTDLNFLISRHHFSTADAQSFTCSVGSGGACPVAFCPGDEVTYTCNVGTVMGATEWRLPDGTCGSPSTISLAQSGACSTLTGTCGPFSAANDGSDGTNCLVSSLTVTASTDLNNTLIQCINVDLSNNPTEVGSAVLIITGLVFIVGVGLVQASSTVASYPGSLLRQKHKSLVYIYNLVLLVQYYTY